MALLSHGVSLIVGDEMQNVNLAASGGEQRLLNLLVRICNTLGISVMFIATPEAIDIFSERYRMMRRVSQQGNPLWERAAENDLDWNMFVEALWEHQYLYKKTKLTPELKQALFRASAGITEVAVRIFQFTQRRAIAYALRKSDEFITPELILSVREEELGLEKSVLTALQQGKEALVDVRDVRTRAPEVIRPSYNSPSNEQTINKKHSAINTQNSSENQSNIVETKNHLLSAKGNESNAITVYERLKKAGFVRAADEFWN